MYEKFFQDRRTMFSEFEILMTSRASALYERQIDRSINYAMNTERRAPSWNVNKKMCNMYCEKDEMK